MHFTKQPRPQKRDRETASKRKGGKGGRTSFLRGGKSGDDATSVVRRGKKKGRKNLALHLRSRPYKEKNGIVSPTGSKLKKMAIFSPSGGGNRILPPVKKRGGGVPLKSEEKGGPDGILPKKKGGRGDFVAEGGEGFAEKGEKENRPDLLF